MRIPSPLREQAKRVLPSTVVRRMRKIVNPAGIHWCRVVMSRECDAFVDRLDTRNLACLEISGGGGRWENREWRSYRTTEYPDYDICTEPLDGEWDVVIAEQVLEHVPDPQRAVDNMYRMLRPGGVLLITTPFMIKGHPSPYDFSRWTADGIRGLLARSGFSRMTVDSWGNRKCLIADMTDDNEWTFYRPGFHSLKNEPRFPIVVWAFAHK